MNQFSSETRHCIEEAWRCRALCLATAMTECLERGGEHVRPQHFRLLMDCVSACQFAADLMAHKSQFHREACALCARFAKPARAIAPRWPLWKPVPLPAALARNLAGQWLRHRTSKRNGHSYGFAGCLPADPLVCRGRRAGAGIDVTVLKSGAAQIHRAAASGRSAMRISVGSPIFSRGANASRAFGR
jgi:hypothetical protein